MLRTMRESSRWIMWVVIVGVGAVFVLYLGIGGGFRGRGGAGTVVDVDGRRYTTRDVDRLREGWEEEQRRESGNDYDPEKMGEFLDEMAATTLMRMAIMSREAERLGLRASDEEIREYLRRIPGAVDDSGHLNKALITDHAERRFGSVRRFQEALRDELLLKKFGRLLRMSVAVPEAEAREAVRYRREQVRIAFVRFDGSKPAKDLEVSDADLKAFLSTDAERVRAAYDEHSADYDRPEQVRARHILIRVPEDADAETVAAARKRIEAIAKRIREGANFADVALEESEDPGSREKGGDLGFFPRGRMAKPFEDAAFSLEPGMVSDVIRTNYGFHLIQVEERKAAMVVPFEEARDEIARDLIRTDRAAESARARAEELAGAVRAGQSLVEAAREAGLTLQRTELIRRRPDGNVPGLGAAPELLTAAFALTEEEPSSPEIFELRDSQFVLIQLLERIEPSAEELDPLVEEERKRLVTERETQLEQVWLEQRRDSLAEHGKLFFSLKALRE